MSILTVGTNGEFQTIAAAVAASSNGDTVLVQAGTYTNDFVAIGHDLTLQAVGGMVNMVATVEPPNGKALLDTNIGNVTINGFSFSGAQVGDGNGAGIRYEGGNLTLNGDYFHDNQDGLLANPDLAGSITISGCEFAHNGAGDGYTHNLYVGDVGSLTITNSYFHDAVVGHEIKSRAENTTITGCRIQDGPAGTASYSIDLPNGGNALIQNNVIEQGPWSQNPAIIAYGEEGGLHAGSALAVTGNTILNDLPGGGPAVWNMSGSVTASVTNNKFFGLAGSQLVSGPASLASNRTLATEPALNTADPWAANCQSVTVDAAQARATIGVSLSTITANAGDHTLFLGGSGNLLCATGGNEWVKANTGGNWLTTGAGNDTLRVGSSGNVVDAGGGTNRIFDDGTNNRIVLAAAGAGYDHIFGAMLTNGDTFDLRAVLGATSWDGNAATVGNYLSTRAINGGADLVLAVRAAGGTSAAVNIATFHGAGAFGLPDLLAHAIL